MKNLAFKILYFITALVIVVELGFAVKGSLFTDIAKLPKGELSYTAASPSGQKHMNVYLIENNVGTAVRVEIQNQNGNHNIFWQTDIDHVNAAWLDDQLIVINGITLNSDDYFGYDSRRGYSLFDEGSLEQNFMNSEG